MVAKRKLSYGGASMGSSAKAARVSVQKKSVAKIARQVVTRMAEKKTFNFAVAELSTNTATPGGISFGSLNDIVLGSGNGQRQGKEISMQSLALRVLLHSNATVTTWARVCIFMMKDQSAPSTATQFFETNINAPQSDPASFTTLGGGTVATCLLPINRAQITPLFDKVVKLSATASIDGSNAVMINKFIKLRGKKCRFDNSTTGAGNQDAPIYIGVWSTEAPNDTAGGSVVEWSFNSRLSYIDI